MQDQLKLTQRFPNVDFIFPGLQQLSRILVADDDPTTSRLLTSIGEDAGFEIVSVSDGREAYRLLKADANFKAAVINMTMPHIEGAEIVRYMRTEKRLMKIPVLIVTGEKGLNLIGDGYAAGAMAFLPKPLRVDQLQRTISLVLASCRAGDDHQSAQADERSSSLDRSLQRCA